MAIHPTEYNETRNTLQAIISPSMSVCSSTALENPTAFPSIKSQLPRPMWNAEPIAPAIVILVNDGAIDLR
jgi:hypothetical protein